MALSFILYEEDRTWISCAARHAILNAVTGRSAQATEPEYTPRVDGSPCASALWRHLGSFVTLTLDSQLRGCMGSIIAREPLWRNIWRMARAAALEDPRFPPLTAEEWSRCRLHISVLDELSPCPDPAAVQVGKHGLVLEYAGRSGVFLPQVPVEQGWDRLAYLDHLCLKAGLPRKSWQQPEARLYWYEADVFEA
ncbi:MAG: AmmeMemoRadiSam system protein A [Desulfovibrio sp.]|nr:AmmeMemoRadiSam system protein A [Desulfovibrio sp.]